MKILIVILRSKEPVGGITLKQEEKEWLLMETKNAPLMWGSLQPYSS